MDAFYAWPKKDARLIGIWQNPKLKKDITAEVAEYMGNTGKGFFSAFTSI
jgi:hypothetical protein